MKQCNTFEKMLEMSSGDRDRAGKVVARSFFRILARNGFSHSDVMNFAGHLLDEVMRDMRRDGGDTESAPVSDSPSGEDTREVA
jgi:hypothetical protein